MSLLTELFGEDVINETLDQVKARINSLPDTLNERKSYLLKDYSKIAGIELNEQDFNDINTLPIR